MLLGALIHALWNAWLRGGKDQLKIRTMMVVSSSVLCLGLLFFLPIPSPAAWPFIALSVVGHLAFNLFLVQMYREGDLSQTYIISRGTQPLLISIGGAIFASEVPTFGVLVGIILVSAGILLLVNMNRVRSSAGKYALLTGGVSSVNSILAGMGIRADEGGVLSYMSWIVALNGIPMCAIYLALRKDLRIWEMERFDWIAAILGGFFATAGYALTIWAMRHAPFAAVSALRETSILFALLLGCTMLREKLTLRKIIASLLTFIGASLISAD